ncbi:Uu.00g094870.m01.CDS01 [Anthostomella pinea]|uniref:Uu.00g094870.m01.CDS01 n=1 Tax=Anthostomella pinea TaxID=933095 RepID=A0AAI8VNP9_9PEZI|nr:Uu.00g094870.m01.CDS01 [Anthostomella pinea]
MTSPPDAPDAAHWPFILIVSHSLSGHLAPMIRISSALHARGWTVYFLGPTAHASRIQFTGATFIPLRGSANLDDQVYYESPPVDGYNDLHWAERVMIDFRVQCLDPLPEQWICVKAALEKLHSLDPDRQVIVLAEAFFYGILPLQYGAPLPGKRPKTLCISVTIPAIRSAKLPPCGYPFPFDPTPAGRELNARLWVSWKRKGAALTALLEQKMSEVGATRSVGEPFLSGANYLCHSKILQLGVPGFEFPRSDWPPGFRFAGLVQGKKANKDAKAISPQEEAEVKAKAKAKQPDFPWWTELVSNSALPRQDPRRKKVVVVAQGTVETNPNDLIIPTIRAFADREDVLVVAILGWRGAKLSLSTSNLSNPDITTTTTKNDENDAIAESPLPANARIADYLSYDAALSHADAWVHNGGFGAVNHGIANGVPMVVAGEGMDKTENTRRVAWSGIGVDLRSATPGVDAVREGVGRVLREGRFPLRVAELRRESEEMDCFGIVHEELFGLVGV